MAGLNAAQGAGAIKGFKPFVAEPNYHTPIIITNVYRITLRDASAEKAEFAFSRLMYVRHPFRYPAQAAVSADDAWRHDVF